MHLDSGVRLKFAVGVTADVGPSVDDEDAKPESLHALLGDREPEQSGANDDQIRVHRSSSSAQCGQALRHPTGCAWVGPDAPDPTPHARLASRSGSQQEGCRVHFGLA